MRWMSRLLVFSSLVWGQCLWAQMSAVDDFEGYTGYPIGAAGGIGDWTSAWGVNSENGGGAYLNTNVPPKISGTNSLGLYGNASAAGESVSRAFLACSNNLTIKWSERGDFNANSTNAPTRRLAFTVRNGNGPSHFDGQRLSFFFAAGTTNFQWWDGVDRATNAVYFVLGHVYDFTLDLAPSNRAYAFSISNRNSGAVFSSSGNWSQGSNGEPIGSVAIMMRGPSGAGNDSFLDNVAVSSPTYARPSAGSLPIREGDTWKFFRGSSMPAAQGTNQWYGRDYNDGAWEGPSPSGFGYGDADDATVLSDMQNNYLSVFTRRPFVIGDTGTVTHLTLAMDYDDGFVANITGIEVARSTMPTGSVNNTTAATGNREASKSGQDNYTCDCDPQEKEYFTLDPSVLVNGTNVLAVSGHNISTASSDFSLITELSTNINLLRGPILQMPNAGRITVLWRTDAATDSAVDYGLDPGYGEGTVADALLVRKHELELPALPPGTTIYYRIRSGGQVLATNSFRSPVAAGQSFRMAIMSDFGSPTTNTLAVAKQVELANPAILLTAGDNVQMNSAPPGLFDSDWFGPLSRVTARMPLMSTIGNHDIRVARGQWYLDAVSLPTNGPVGLGERTYSYDYGNVHVVSLDGNAFVPDSETTYTNAAAMRTAILAWLTNDLASATQQWKFAIYHQPHYTSLGYHDDTALLKSLVAPIYEQYGVQIAFQGHNHMYERINPINGVSYVTVGSGGFSKHDITTRREYSAAIFNDKYDCLIVDIDGPHLVLRCIDQDGAQRDVYYRDLDHPFNMDGRLDAEAKVLASNTLNTIKLYGAIRGNYLYVAGQDAPPPANGNNDHFIFVNTNLTGQSVPANWAKTGSNMLWSAFLGDESINGLAQWFGPTQVMLTNPAVYRSTSSGLFQNGTNKNGALEGTIQLPLHFGNFPPELCLAFAPYTTADGGTVLWEYQIPPATAGDNINSNEYLRISTRSIALDLPVASAGTNQSLEAGMPALLNGNASTNPSGLALSFLWDEPNEAAGVFANAGASATSFVLTNQPPAVTSIVVRLRVNDTRFDDTGTVTLAFTPWVDSDGDGLSDSEESTGEDNLLTPYNPAGKTSNPLAWDSDGDGLSDGSEARAGTDPGNSNSVFRFVSDARAAGDVVLQWSSASGRTYSLLMTTNLADNVSALFTNIPATPSLNSYTVPVSETKGFFSVGVE